MKRVFTKWLGGVRSIAIPASVWGNEVLQFTAQEPLTVIGAHLEIGNCSPAENDGFPNLELELSFSATARMDVAFLSAQCYQWWNTTPASGMVALGNQVVMFPPGYGLSMKEGETVFLNIKSENPPTAGISTMQANAHIYYVKGAPTSN